MFFDNFLLMEQMVNRLRRNIVARKYLDQAEGVEVEVEVEELKQLQN